MTNAVQLCPQCLSGNVIAPLNGPTCPHQEPNGAAWWPNGWVMMSEGERLEWLAKKGSQ